MTEPFANEQLSAYLDGELEPSEVTALEAQLREDAVLREELEALRGVRDFLHMEAPVHAPDHFMDALMLRVQDEPAPVVQLAAWWRRPFGVPLEALAVAAVALVVIGVGTLQTPSVPTQADPLQQDEDAVADADPTPEGAGDAVDAPKDVEEAKLGAAAAVAPREPPPPPKISDGIAQGKGSMPTSRAPSTRGSMPDEGDALQEKGGTSSLLLKTEADAPTTAPELTAPSGGTSTPKPSMTAGVRYTLIATDADVLAGLQRVAAKHRGSVKDEAGRAPSEKTFFETESGVFFVELPATEMARFARDLENLGLVQAIREDDWFGGEVVRVRVDVSVDAPTLRSTGGSKPAN